MNIAEQQYRKKFSVPCICLTVSNVLKQFVYFAIYINIKTQTLVNHSIYKMSRLIPLNVEFIAPINAQVG